LPDFTADEIQTMLLNYRTEPIEEILETERKFESDGIKLHPNAQEFLQKIKAFIVANEKTVTEHSTLDEIQIEFLDENNRKIGLWSRQMVMPPDAEEMFEKTVLQWIKEKICEEIIDLDDNRTAQEKEMGVFNTNCFLTFSGKWHFVHNFTLLNKLIKDDTNDIPGIDTIFQKLAKSGATIYSKIDLLTYKSCYENKIGQLQHLHVVENVTDS
jgi:hypothetical protein